MRSRRQLRDGMTIRFASRWLILLAAFSPLLSGCEVSVGSPGQSSNNTPHEIQLPPGQAAVVGKGAELQASAAKSPFQERAAQRAKFDAESADTQLAQADARPGGDRRDGGNSTGGPKSNFGQRQAFEQVAVEIRDSLSLRKTLVVWLVEQTEQSGNLATTAAEQIARLMQDIKGSDANPLEMAVIGYGSEANLLTQKLLSEAGELRKAIAALKEKKDDKANAFAAFQMAVEKFLPYRDQGYEVMFVVVGASSGDDLPLADDAINALKRQAVDVYGIGPAVPFGLPGGGNGRGGNPRRPQPAPMVASGKRQYESLAPERIQLALSGGEASSDLTDSGYGPFGLERICRQTDGKFFRLHDARPAGWEADSSTGDIPTEIQEKYAPDYVNEQQYQQLLAANKCRMALHNAAMLPPTVGLESPRMSFEKPKDEAALAKDITNAQKAAAESDQPIQKLYDTLAAGEADRSKLTGARWQAEFDLAMGQALAAKARLDGYNAMLAILKQGKQFANAESRRWVLEPADEIAAGSALDKMAKNSRVYLKRVISEHPGTPWAAIAQRELRYPAGWKLVER